MKISIIGGAGYVGLITGLGLAFHGHDVICMDNDQKKIDLLNSGQLPVYEKDLAELLKAAMTKNRVVFTNCIKTAVQESDLIMITVGTSGTRNGETDMSQLLKALKSLSYYMDNYKVIIIKSTVPVGTCDMAKRVIRDNLKNPLISYDLVSNPEFLKEGNAVSDFLQPDRIVVGVDTPHSEAVMKELYKTFDAPLIVTDTRSAEMVKYACNAYLATRISFINEIAEISEHVDADIHAIQAAMKLDQRIGNLYLNPGPGFGGPCLVKDLKSLLSFADKANVHLPLLQGVLNRNEAQITNIFHYINSEIKDSADKKISVLGLSFKAGTDDTRNSPAVRMLEKLIDTKANIYVYDPVVKSLPEHLQSRVTLAGSIEDCIFDADCLIVMTEWPEFQSLNLETVYHLMQTPFIVDTRNIFHPKNAYDHGFWYKGIGVTSSRYTNIAEVLENINYA